MLDSKEQATDGSSPLEPCTAYQGSMDHVLEIMASHKHPLLLVGCSASRWMGSAGMITSSCDLLVRDSALKSVASKLIETGHWKTHDPGQQVAGDPLPLVECDADLVLERVEIEHDSEYQYINFWSDTTYRISVDNCPVVEVPDVYPWHHILMEEKWHPAVNREDGWWFGPRLHPETKVPNLPARAKPRTMFLNGLPRGKSASNHYPVLIPSLPTYLDALIYHTTRYRCSKPGLALIASWQIRNLTRYLYLELPHQQLPLLIELEEDEFMENYLVNFVRKPFFVYGPLGPEFKATRVREWDPTSYPEWCKTTK